MCGILGYISSHKCENVNPERFERALNLMEHRGPDDSGVFYKNGIALGHRRLSIIDISTYAKQPMLTKDGKGAIVFNGEIYNYQELRKELEGVGHQFTTMGDTEVLLCGLHRFGPKFLEKCIGMFAFIYADLSSNTFYIARDRLGIKPLYYHFGEDAFIFASEPKAILALLDKKPDINKSAISSYLSFRYPILGDTFFEGISSLEPGSYLKVSKGAVSKHVYWDPSCKMQEQKEDKGEDFYIEKLQELLQSAVSYRMIADVPVGAYLSGGVDSSVVVSEMAHLRSSTISTFTIGFPEEKYNEFPFSRRVASKCQTDHHEIIMEGQDYLSLMEHLISFKDAPLGVPNEVPLYAMSKELKKYITVVLSGEGADELFGGYGRIFRSTWDFERMSRGSKDKGFSRNFHAKYGSKKFTSELDHFMHLYSYTSFEEKQNFLSKDFPLAQIEQQLRGKFQQVFDQIPSESYFNKMLFSFQKLHLLGLLHRLDTCTMATSVEGRVPFVDHRLLEFSLTVPEKYKLRWNDLQSKEQAKTLLGDKISELYDTPKYLLKKSYEARLPKEILYRKKMGFPVPLDKWFTGDFSDYAKQILLDKQALSRGLYNEEGMCSVLNNTQYLSQHSNAMKIWMLINLEIFIQNNERKGKKNEAIYSGSGGGLSALSAH